MEEAIEWLPPPYQPTHWLRLRVDLGLQLHSGMDSPTGAGSESPLPALLCDVVVMACTHTQQTEQGREGGLEKREFFSPDQRECALLDFLALKKSVVEGALHRAPH